MKQSLIFGAVLLASAARAIPVYAEDPYLLWDKARVASDQIKYPFLYPGFRFLIQPVSEGGESIAAVYDGDGGFALCISGQNPSNEAVPAPFHCNFRVEAPALHVPANVIFGNPDKKTKVKNFLKSLAWVGSVGLSANSEFPLASELGSTVASVSEQSPSSPIVSEYRYSKTMSKIKLYAQKAEDRCEINPPSQLAPFAMGDLTADLSSRLNDFFKKCSGYGINLSKKADVHNPENQTRIANYLENLSKNGVVNEDKSDEVFCHEQEENQEMFAIVASNPACDIQVVSPQAGETNNPELWFPGQSITTPCRNALLNEVATKDYKPLVDPNGAPYHIGAPALAWVYYQSQKVQSIAPTTTDEATAEHSGECLAKNPAVAAEAQKRFQAAYEDALKLTPVDPPAAAPAPPATPPAAPAN